MTDYEDTATPEQALVAAIIAERQPVPDLLTALDVIAELRRENLTLKIRNQELADAGLAVHDENEALKAELSESRHARLVRQVEETRTDWKPPKVVPVNSGPQSA